METSDAVFHPEDRRTHAEPIRRSIRHMQGRLAEKLALDEMAAVACMSSFHFLRVFQSLTGVPPARFFGALRLEAAKGLLMRTDRSVLDICQDVGYSSLGTFTTRFAQLVGLAPARYREMYRELRSCSGAGATALPRQKLHASRNPHWRGRIEHVPQNALLFVGLFESRIPQALPLACDILAGTREFQLDVPDDADPDAAYHVLSVALVPVSDFDRLFDNRSLIGAVGVAGPVTARDLDKSISLALRPPDLLDPPVLVAFPLLMHVKLGGLPPFAPSIMPKPVFATPALQPSDMLAL